MVIIQNKSGQLANRLFAFSHFIANAIEHDYRLFNPTFDEYGKHFPLVRENDFAPGRISVRSGIGMGYPLFKLASRGLLAVCPKSPWHAFIEDTTPDGVYDLNSPEFIDAAKSGKRLFMRGWNFRDFKHHAKHRDEIRRIFTPDAHVMDWVGGKLADARASGRRVIGVHIRRGDYAIWEGGRFFYTNDEYLRWMLQLDHASRAEGVETVFVICSNEELSPADFPGVSVTMAKGDLIQDLYLLSGCDLIFGPPSTYSLWASFYGDVPVHHCQNKEEEISFQQFEKKRDE